MKLKTCLWAAGLACILCTMAYASGEIIANLTLKVTKGSLNITRTSAVTTNMLGAENVAGFTQSIATNGTGTAITLGDVSTNGVAWFANLGTNLVRIGVRDVNTNFIPLVAVNPGEAWPVRLDPACAPYAMATNAATIIEKLVFQN